MCNLSRKAQFETLERLFNAVCIGYVASLRDGDSLPLLSEILAYMYDEFRVEVGRPLLSQKEVEAYTLRRLVATPVPGLRRLSKYYLSEY